MPGHNGVVATEVVGASAAAEASTVVGADFMVAVEDFAAAVAAFVAVVDFVEAAAAFEVVEAGRAAATGAEASLVVAAGRAAAMGTEVMAGDIMATAGMVDGDITATAAGDMDEVTATGVAGVMASV
jgi:hypothetical protein